MLELFYQRQVRREWEMSVGGVQSQKGAIEGQKAEGSRYGASGGSVTYGLLQDGTE